MAVSEAIALKDLIVPLVTAVGGAGMWSFFIKVRERRLDDLRADDLIIKGATSVVDLQQKIMVQLQEDLDRRINTLEETHRKQLENERKDWDVERKELKLEISELSKRLQHLEGGKVDKQPEPDLTSVPPQVVMV